MFLFYESKMLTVALTTDSSEKASAPTLTDVSTEITKLLNPNRREITIVYKIANVIENKTLSNFFQEESLLNYSEARLHSQAKREITQRCILDPAKHLQWSIFVKETVKYIAKMLHNRCLI